MHAVTKSHQMAVATCVIVVAAWLVLASPAAAINATSSACDIRNDGAEDLVIAAPNEDIGAIDDAGALWVIPAGNASGGPDPATLDLINVAGAQLFHQSTPGVPGLSEANDRWATTVACGDFDNDGFADIVVGVPDEDIGTQANAGAITILYGSANGITTAGATLISQSTPGVAGFSEPGDEWGAALAVGDFDNDGIDDLAVGAPGEGIGALNDAGAVWVFFGDDPAGLSIAGHQLISQSTPGTPGVTEADDGFGAELAVGDLDNDGIDDLVIGAPNEDVGANADSGAVFVFPGTNSGVSTTTGVILFQSNGGVPGAAEAGDLWGFAISVFDLNDDGTDDLFVGAFGEDIGAVANAGALWMFRGGALGTLGSRGHLIFDSAVDENASFGSRITPYTNASGDLAVLVGAPGQDRLDGAVTWLQHGIACGVEWGGSGLVLGERFEAEIEADAGEVFITDAISSGDYNGDGTLDYILASAYVNAEAGGVWVFNHEHDQRFIDQATPGLPGLSEAEDLWGFALG